MEKKNILQTDELQGNKAKLEAFENEKNSIFNKFNESKTELENLRAENQTLKETSAIQVEALNNSNKTLTEKNDVNFIIIYTKNLN